MGQLQEASLLKKALAQIPSKGSDTAQLGSLVQTPQGMYYLAISIGKVMLENKPYFVVSPASPIGKLLHGKKAGDEAVFNGRKISIKAVD